jgi:hypothetical protein
MVEGRETSTALGPFRTLFMIKLRLKKYKNKIIPINRP